MTIISILICDIKDKRILLSQNFISLSKVDLQSHFTFFLKHYPSSFLEQFPFKYMSIPIASEHIYLITITSFNSNIILDMQTVKLIHQCVCKILSHEYTCDAVIKKGIDIVLMIEEVIYFGMRSGVKNVADVDKMTNMIQSNIQDIKRIRKEELEKERKVLLKQMEEYEKRMMRDDTNNKEENVFKKQIGNGVIEHTIHLNEKFNYVQIRKPLMMYTPSGKVVSVSKMFVDNKHTVKNKINNNNNSLQIK